MPFSRLQSRQEPIKFDGLLVSFISCCHATHPDHYLVPQVVTLYQTVSTVYFTLGISSLFKAPR